MKAVTSNNGQWVLRVMLLVPQEDQADKYTKRLNMASQRHQESCQPILPTFCKLHQPHPDEAGPTLPASLPVTEQQLDLLVEGW